MKVIKPMKVPVLHRVIEVGRRPYFHLGAMIAFPLATPRALLDELAFWTAISAALGPLGVVDEGISKARGEVLVCGSFFAPEGKPLPASYVRARLGPVDKRLAIVGDRVWQGGTPTPPEPVETMPVDWTRAFGGPRYDRNPYGKGAEPVEVGGQAVHPLPNIERYGGGAMVRAPSERPEPAGFLPMDVTFAQRRSRAGTYDRRYLEDHFPGLPSDADPTFFNVAPEDQWIHGFFRGDEELSVENMHPSEPRLEGRLPGLVARSFVTHRTREGERFVEIPLRCDTVWLFPSAGLGVVIFHGAREVADDDAADIVHLVCACEDPSSPRPVEHYRGVLARRLDKDKGALAGISDGELMPARASGVAPDIGLLDMDMGRWLKGENLALKNARRGQERQLAEARARLEAEGLDPKEHGVAELPPEEEEPPLDDLDALAAFMEKQSERGALELEGIGAREAEAREEARRLYAEMGEDYDAIMADAERRGGGPPKFSASAHLDALRGMAEEARADGFVLEDIERSLADPGYRAAMAQQEERLREMYRSFAHLQPAAAAMEDGASERARIVVALARESNESLAGRDFTGAKLAGLCLAGVDLSSAFLEAADLSGSDLSGACLAGAVLARANLRGANLSGARLSGANLGGAVLCDATLDRADLTEVTLGRADLAGARLTGADLTGADWLEAKLGPVDLSNAQLGQCNLLKADLRGARFMGADLSDANLVECELDGADFSRATLVKTTFVGCRGERVSFREARLRQGVIVHGSSLREADFRDADMEKANLRGTSLVGARLDRCNLAGADLSECDASGASLERAVMKGSLLIRTNLTGASLLGANLMDALASKAQLAGADFTGANLFRADLSRVVGDGRTTFAEAEIGHVRFLPKAEVPPRSGS
ncbi:hypothetical protein SOCE26_100310 [Sorangium cellulosum]|uniref:DUF2169 domain-containing protein n=1 Tax=Sorangium cellulosum TaxID=56 RepID=A0A2L0FAC4_SORCE|nr:DUF2169 domain-containing protein [Sorangium cellulosum]AUX48493.1 hypothetical protein SOCE26_100310 [Sorangium cellulosum]